MLPLSIYLFKFNYQYKFQSIGSKDGLAIQLIQKVSSNQKKNIIVTLLFSLTKAYTQDILKYISMNGTVLWLVKCIEQCTGYSNL